MCNLKEDKYNAKTFKQGMPDNIDRDLDYLYIFHDVTLIVEP